MATHFSILAWRIPTDRGTWWATVHGVAESDRTEATEHSRVRCLRLKEGTLTAFSMCPRGSVFAPQAGLAKTGACRPGPTLYMPPANRSKCPLLG